jgi:hypothetical protein
MILENFIAWTASTMTPKCFTGAVVGINNIGGNCASGSLNANAYYSNTTQGVYVDIGFGDTVPASSDYKLEDSNACDTPTLTFISTAVSRGYPDIRNVTTVYRNDTGSAVIVKEVGIVGTGSQASNNTYNGLLSRTVLDNPITVNAGETMAFTVALEV